MISPNLIKNHFKIPCSIRTKYLLCKRNFFLTFVSRGSSYHFKRFLQERLFNSTSILRNLSTIKLEQLPISTSTISDKATEKLVEEFNYLRAQAVGDFAKFFDYITYSYQIDNVVLLITGTLHEWDTHELLERCHSAGSIRFLRYVLQQQLRNFTIQSSSKPH